MATPTKPGNEDRHVQTVLNAFDTLFNKRDYEAAAKFWSDTYIQHSAHIEPGRDGLFSLIRSTPSTLRYEHQLIVAEGDYVIVNYDRATLGQTGGGHISPLGAYDQLSDSVLVLDVNPTGHPWVWVEATALFKAMATKDTVENRGYLLVREGP